MTTNNISHAIVLALLCANLFTATGFAQTATISTIAGPGLPTNGSSAVTQPIDLPTAVAPDGAGGFYVTVTGQNRVYRVSAAGVVSVIAGTSSWGYSGDGGRAVAAQLRNPRGIAVDGAGNLFIADTV